MTDVEGAGSAGRWAPAARLADQRGRSALCSLAQGLRDNGFTEAQATRALGAQDGTDLLSSSALHTLCSADVATDLVRDSAGVLIQLFVRHGAVARARFQHVVSAPLRQLLRSLDLVVTVGNVVTSRISISPWRSRYFLSDPLFRTGMPDSLDLTMCDRRGMVMPPHASSLTLMEHAVGAGGTLLDAGSGCGVIALTLCDRYRAAMGVDINPRAVAFSEANAMANGRHVEVQLGDVFTRPGIGGPVNHLLLNSPTGPAYHPARTEAGWMTAEQVLTSLARSLPRLLRSGGLAQVLAIVEVPEGRRSASELVHGWLRELPGRASVRVVELADSPLGVAAGAVARCEIEPGCVLVGGPGDAMRLLMHLRSRGIREIVPAVISVEW